MTDVIGSIEIYSHVIENLNNYLFTWWNENYSLVTQIYLIVK